MCYFRLFILFRELFYSPNDSRDSIMNLHQDPLPTSTHSTVRLGLHQFPHQQLQERFLVGGAPPPPPFIEPALMSSSLIVDGNFSSNQQQQPHRAPVELHLFSSSAMVLVHMALDASFLDVVAFLQRKWGAALLEDDGGTVLEVFVLPPSPSASPSPPLPEHRRASLMWGGGERYIAGVQMKLRSILTMKEQQQLQRPSPPHNVSHQQQHLWTSPYATSSRRGDGSHREVAGGDKPTIVVVVSLGVERRESAARAVIDAHYDAEQQALQEAFLQQQFVYVTFRAHAQDLKEWASMGDEMLNQAKDASAHSQRGLEEELLLGSCIALLSGCHPSSLKLARSHVEQPTTTIHAAALVGVLHKPQVWRQAVAALSSGSTHKGNIVVVARKDATLSDVVESMPWWPELCEFCHQFLMAHGIGHAAPSSPQLSLVRSMSADGTASVSPLEAITLSLRERPSVGSLLARSKYRAPEQPQRSTTTDGRHNLLEIMASFQDSHAASSSMRHSLQAEAIEIWVSVKTQISFWRTRARVFVDASEDPSWLGEGDADGNAFRDLTYVATAAPHDGPKIINIAPFSARVAHPSLPRASLYADVLWSTEVLAALEGAYVCFTRGHREPMTNNDVAASWNATASLRPYEQSRLWWQHKVGVFLDGLGFQVRLGRRTCTVEEMRRSVPASVPPSVGHRFHDPGGSDAATYEAMVQLDASKIDQSTRLHSLQHLGTLEGRWHVNAAPHRALLVDVVAPAVRPESVQLAKFLIHVRCTGLLEEYRYPGLHDATRMVLLFSDIRNRWTALCGAR
jgi:hypothetical protein